MPHPFVDFHSAPEKQAQLHVQPLHDGLVAIVALSTLFARYGATLAFPNERSVLIESDSYYAVPLIRASNLSILFTTSALSMARAKEFTNAVR